ncbi:MAG TPA: MarR family transcriptional regulator [Thermoanaerobaculia bacterium]|nr:MarR family transcriptional regulator [Thermoanaerobaculia bacterium]
MTGKATSRPSVEPLAVADRLHSAAIRVLRRVRVADEESGLSAARLSALSVVVYGGPLPLGRLAEIEQVRAPTMTALVRGLESDGLVRRSAGRRDRRVVLVTATARGRRVLEQARRRRLELLATVLERLTPAERRQVGAAAAALLEALSIERPRA